MIPIVLLKLVLSLKINLLNQKVACNITYNCKDSNDCAKVFYQKNIQILIEKESVLNQIRNELYDPMINNIQQCVDHNDQSMACVNAYGCHGYEIIENNKSQYHGECRNASSMTARQYLYSEITLVQGYPTSASDWNHLGYTCNKRNLCNTNEQIKQMVKIANNFYPWEFIGVNSSVNLTISNYYIVLLLFLFYFTY
ncbi:hypothetical protein I4U23_015477 [Adineta vaga]|nr:hypothetical protein I4U23_015477 [Adineta vaga]